MPLLILVDVIMKYILIINGREDKKPMRDIIDRQVMEFKSQPCNQNYDIETYVTTGEGDATRYVRVYSDLHPLDHVCFIACGGDGTINEVASGMVGFQNKMLAILDYGTGNDFVKYYAGRDFKNLSTIFQSESKLIDIMKINDNYSINVCDFGFDSVVGSTANILASKGVKNPFQWGIVKAIFSGRFNRISVTADGEKLGRHRLLLCTLANNSYVGSGFFCAPHAKNDDGLIEVCFVRPMSLLRFLFTMPIYREGKHLDDKKNRKFIYRQAKHVEVDSKSLVELCLDGEMLPGTHFDITILPKAIRLVIPNEVKSEKRKAMLETASQFSIINFQFSINK